MKKRNNNYKRLGYQQRSGMINNMVTNSKDWEPFRISDSRMVMGKYKNKLITELPKDYIQWMISQPSLSQSRRTILQKLNDSER